MPYKIVTGLVFTPSIAAVPGQFRFSADWDRTGPYFNNVANEIYLVQTVGSDIYNGSISWAAPGNKLSVTLDGRNLANTHYVLAGLQLASAVRPSVTGYINEPRQIMLRVRKDF